MYIRWSWPTISEESILQSVNITLLYDEFNLMYTKPYETTTFRFVLLQLSSNSQWLEPVCWIYDIY